MVFGSVAECIAYIENAIESCMPTLATEIKRIMDEVTYSQVRGWSGQIFSSVVANSGGMSAEAEFSDNGNWYSLITGASVGNPIKFLEAGTTWNRGATSIMSTALGNAEGRIPPLFASLMISMGIPIS